MPGGGHRILGEVIDDDRTAFAEGRCCRPTALRKRLVGGDYDVLGVFRPRAVGLYGDEAIGFGVVHPDPGHAHTAEVHRDATDKRKQLGLIAHAHDGLIDLTECLVKLGQAQESRRRGRPLEVIG